MQGVVAMFNSKKFYGFIKPEDGSHDVFVHGHDLLDVGELIPGDLVEYDIGTDKRTGKTRAQNVRIVKEAAA